ncbi:unnamed protein product [Soboliphyme baturini]|uniref:V-SNARE coiled-coil homology domain-containing protein n=1 Tax=Soboliphyme baturini TaxID=241478 RepID=A0A183J1M6_9BILA|nr:unnamed protein product [Soboliphyme baturini]
MIRDVVGESDSTAEDVRKHENHNAMTDGEKDAGTVTVSSSSTQIMEEDLKQKLANLLSLSGSMSRVVAKNLEDARKKRYEFWSSQPVPQFGKILHCYRVCYIFIIILIICIIIFNYIIIMITTASYSTECLCSRLQSFRLLS